MTYVIIGIALVAAFFFIKGIVEVSKPEEYIVEEEVVTFLEYGSKKKRPRSRKYAGKKYRIRSKTIQNPVNLDTAVEIVRKRDKLPVEKVFILVKYFMPTKAGFYMDYEIPEKHIAIDELGLYNSKANYGHVNIIVQKRELPRITVNTVISETEPLPQPEPKPEQFGWVEPNFALGEEGGWTVEGGEEAYEKAHEKWKLSKSGN